MAKKDVSKLGHEPGDPAWSPPSASALAQALPRKVYRISPARRAIPAVIFACIIFFFIALAFLSKDQADREPLGITVIILTVIFAFIYSLVWYPHLVVSPNGVECYMVGWSMSTPWGNIVRLERGRGLEGLVLRQPPADRGIAASRLGRRLSQTRKKDLPAWYRQGQDRFVEEDRWFSLEPFAWWFQHRRLEWDFAQYAPWLLAEQNGP